MLKLILLTLFTLNLSYADDLLDREMNIAVPLIDEAQKLDEVLNGRVRCPSTANEEKDNLQKEVPPCDPQVSANGTGNPVNTSIVDLRRIVSEAQARCPNCRQGGGFRDRRFDDELQRRRMNDARNRNRRGDRTDWSTVNQIPLRYMQTLVPGYPLNYSDPVIGNDLKKVHDQIRNPIEGCNIRDEARFASGAFLAQASESAGAGDYEEAKAFLKVAKDLANFATGVVPGISEARDAYEFFTGEELSPTARTLAALGMIPFLGGAIKGGKALGKLARFTGKRFPNIYKGMTKVADRVGDLARKVDRWNPCSVGATNANPCRYSHILPMKHIWSGNFSESGKIIGGLHSKDSLLNYFKKNPDIFKDARNIPNPVNNGVTRWELPRRAFEGRPPPSRAKTLFPDSWTPEKIADAANSIINGRSLSDLPNPTIGIFDGVKIKIGVKDGKVTTVFPDWPQ